jgi:hypothetical protein
MADSSSSTEEKMSQKTTEINLKKIPKLKAEDNTTWHILFCLIEI